MLQKFCKLRREQRECCVLLAKGCRKARKSHQPIGEIKEVEHTIVDNIRIKQLVGYGHVQRMDNRLRKQMLT